VSQAPRTLLAFDYGRKRIGVAVGQELTQSATALTTLKTQNNSPPWDSISELINNWQPQALVVGLPLNKDGSEHEISAAAKRFGNQLQERYNLPVYWIDERLTSFEAEHILGAQQNKKKSKSKKEDIDMIAAQLILQSWFAQQLSRNT